MYGIYISTRSAWRHLWQCLEQQFINGIIYTLLNLEYTELQRISVCSCCQRNLAYTAVKRFTKRPDSPCCTKLRTNSSLCNVSLSHKIIIVIYLACFSLIYCYAPWFIQVTNDMYTISVTWNS